MIENAGTMIGLKMEKKEAIEHLISVMDENGTIFRGGVDSILNKEIEEKTIEACRVGANFPWSCR